MARTSSAFAAPQTATTVAPACLAIWIRKVPTPPDAPVTSTTSPARSPAISIMFIAVPPEQGSVAKLGIGER